MALVEAYFDESADDGTTFLCVAGYLFDKDRCLQLDGEWAATLKRFKDLPYFRMSRCAHHREPFDRLTKGECIEVATSMIESIKTHALHGIFVSVNEKEFLRAMEPLNPFGAAYTWCCFMCLVGAQKWADANNFDGDIAYFFEAGQQYQKQANALMAEICQIDELKQAFRYHSHTFVDKVKCRPVQAADILAWQGATNHKRAARGEKRMRRDFKSLLECNTRGYHATEDRFAAFQQFLDGLPMGGIKDMMDTKRKRGGALDGEG